ncbi:hypothetical protein KIPB_004322, partial [Kipferlia bialata]|eukprot:g4322.t1
MLSNLPDPMLPGIFLCALDLSHPRQPTPDTHPDIKPDVKLRGVHPWLRRFVLERAVVAAVSCCEVPSLADVTNKNGSRPRNTRRRVRTHTRCRRAPGSSPAQDRPSHMHKEVVASTSVHVSGLFVGTSCHGVAVNSMTGSDCVTHSRHSYQGREASSHSE